MAEKPMIDLARLLQALLMSVNRRPIAPVVDRTNWTCADWARVRAPERHRDRVLSDKARRWLARLPGDMRPNALSERFPRIVNRLAALWRDEGLIEILLLDLLTDARGGRQGFPPTVFAELEVLYELHTVRIDSASSASDAWSLCTQS
jgi:hypothetical protein